MPAFSERFRIRKHFDLLNHEERKAIHDAALHVMENTGVRIHSRAARADLKRAGAIVRDGSPDVRFPPDVVRDLVGKAPREIVLAGRTKEFDLPMDGTHFYTTTDGCGIGVWDAATGTRRESVLEDVRRTAVIADWLPCLSIYEPMVVAHDVPEQAHVVLGMKAAMENTEKHLLSESTTNPAEARAEVRLAAAVVGSEAELQERHYISAMLCPMSPLAIDGAAGDATLVWAEHHVPVHIYGMAQAGVSGPPSLAGDLVVNHAEVLAAVCMIEAHAPRAPAIYGACLTNMDPRTGAYMAGSPESDLLAAGAIEMGKFCRLPVSVGGMGTSAKIPGVEAALENALWAMTCANYGGEVMNGFGEPSGSTLLSYEQLLLDHEIARMILRIYQGFDVDEAALAVDLIEKVGIGGTYLAQRETLQAAREAFLPMLWDGEPFDVWVRKGRKDPMALAREKVEWILKEHAPVPLPDETTRRLDRIAHEAAKA
ncbi:MAG: trimethylamine methyltransferase family protein [Thermoplasmata archaeon]